jgi:Cu/Ag efflux protein CusF
MTHHLNFLIAAACLLVTTGCAMTGTTTQPEAPAVASVTKTAPGSVEQTSVASVTAIVEKVDVAARKVTLRTADGRKTTLSVGPEVKNLPQVERGDEVIVNYLESVAIHVKKPGEGRMGTVAGEDVQTAKLGEKPAGAAARTVQITARIVAIDRAAEEVTLEDEAGDRVTIDVRNPEHYAVIAVGDLVEITHTEAMAISVESVPVR